METDQETKQGEEVQPLTTEEAQATRDEAAKELWGDDVDAGKIPETETSDDETASSEEAAAAEASKSKEETNDNDDPWAGVNPALRKSFEYLQEKVSTFDEVSHRLKQAEKRIGSLTNQLSEAHKAAEEAIKAQEKETPTEEEVAAALESEEAFKEMEEEFPEFTKALKGQIDNQSKRIEEHLTTIDELKTEIKTLKEGQQSATSDDAIAGLEQKLKLELRHPGWEKTVNTKEFVEFSRTLTVEQAEKLDSPNAEDAAEILDLFEDSKGNNSTESRKKSAAQIKAEREERLRKSRLPESKGTKKKIVSEDNMTNEEYREKLASEMWADD